MADIKKFTGYIAVDNSHHDTRKAAIAHSTDVKIKQALEVFEKSVENEENGDESLADFLFRHRVILLAALTQKASLKGPNKTPRKPRPPKVVNQSMATLSD